MILILHKRRLPILPFLLQICTFQMLGGPWRNVWPTLHVQSARAQHFWLLCRRHFHCGQSAVEAAAVARRGITERARRMRWHWPVRRWDQRANHKLATEFKSKVQILKNYKATIWLCLMFLYFLQSLIYITYTFRDKFPHLSLSLLCCLPIPEKQKQTNKWSHQTKRLIFNSRQLCTIKLIVTSLLISITMTT